MAIIKLEVTISTTIILNAFIRFKLTMNVTSACIDDTRRHN